MDKRYQVFVSSTYADLKQERQKVIQTLMEMDCIPSGMELFPAADEEQFEFIKKIIDDCDYYLLIVGGRYGSTTSEGLSYTEKEYDYAIDKGLKVIAFLHKNPDEIIAGKTDKNPELAEKLAHFREKVQQNRLVKYWQTAEELPGLVSLSLSKTIRTYPAVGWVRASGVASTELLTEINTLRKENTELRNMVQATVGHPTVEVDDIADMSETIEIKGRYKPGYDYSWREWKQTLSWNQIFALIAPYLLENPNDGVVKISLKQSILKQAGITYHDSNIEDQDFQTIKIQLKAYGLIDLKYTGTTKGGMALFWSLTNRGEALMVKLRAVRKVG